MVWVGLDLKLNPFEWFKAILLLLDGTKGNWLSLIGGVPLVAFEGELHSTRTAKTMLNL